MATLSGDRPRQPLLDGAAGGPGDEGAALGIDHQHVVDSWAGGLRTPYPVCRGEVGGYRADKVDRDRGGTVRRHGECDLSWLGARRPYAAGDRRRGGDQGSV